METLRFFPTTRLPLISRLPESFGDGRDGRWGGHGRERRNQKKCFEVEKYFNKPIVSVAGQPQKPGQELRRRSPQELPIATSPFRTHRETEAQK